MILSLFLVLLLLMQLLMIILLLFWCKLIHIHKRMHETRGMYEQMAIMQSQYYD